jgi:RND family efflux transporter MFP subunit
VSGTVNTPNSPVSASFLVSGKVIFVGPREGDHVKRGQILASIDPTDYQLDLAAAKAQTERAGVEYKRAEDEHRRMKMLYDSNSLAPNDYEKFKAAYESAEQQYDQSLASEKLSRKRLTDATLYAPTSGFISKRSIEPGDTASTGRPVFEIVQMDPVEVNVGVPETDVHLVRIGQKAAITVPALPGKSFEGTVRIINVSADPNTRTYMTRITVANPENILRVGMVAEATIRGDRTVSMVTLPGDAVVRDPQGATQVYVYYPDQKRVYAKRVEIGTTVNRDIEIKSGLSGDEWIVLAGQTRLRDGSVVSASQQQSGSEATAVGGARR